MPTPRLLVFSTALATAFASSACAQPIAPPAPAQDTAPAATPVPKPQPSTLTATEDPRLPQVGQAIAAAERGDFDAAEYGDLSDHPLYRWVEYASLRRNIDSVAQPRAQAFLERYRGEAVAEEFRELWLAATARREDWPAFMAAWSDDVDRLNLRCSQLDARQALGRVDAQWIADAQAIWRDAGRSLPSECDTPIEVLAARDGLPPALRWERIEKAAREGFPGVMRAAAKGLPEDQRALAGDYAGFLERVDDSALAWPKTPRSRLMASLGLARLAQDDPDAAEAALPRFAQALDFSEEDRGRVLYQIALWTVASYLPGSERRLEAVPASAYDERLHEWRVRGALARSDWPAALAAIKAMSEKQRSDSRYEYLGARLAELTGDDATAQRLYRQAAREAEFHGFLAADRLGQPYALCPWEIDATAAEKAAVAATPALVRALALHKLDRDGWAAAEWHNALDDFDAKQQRIAVEVAKAHGWYDRAVFTLGKDGDPRELQLYTLRFPLHHGEVIKREAAKNGIDPAWVAAEIRAESIFDPDARSAANAMGLMQVLPSTGAAVARRIGVPWEGTASLYEPETNIVLGSAYLREMLDRYGGRPYFAIAGYNAGPAPLSRWQEQRPGMDADFWIETISYKETREYVARVLAFSVIYDWLLDGDALRLSDRLQGRVDGPRKGFACPAPTPAPAAKPAPAPASGS